MQEDIESNRRIIESIAECEQTTGRKVSLIRDLQVYDHRTKKGIANITLAASINRMEQQSIPLQGVGFQGQQNDNSCIYINGQRG